VHIISNNVKIHCLKFEKCVEKHIFETDATPMQFRYLYLLIKLTNLINVANWCARLTYYTPVCTLQMSMAKGRADFCNSTL